MTISGGSICYCLAVAFVAMLPAMILSEKLPPPEDAVLRQQCGSLAVLMLLLGLFRGPSADAVLCCGYFLPRFNLLEAMLPSWLSKVCPAGRKGTAMGIYSTSQFLGAFAGGVLGGWSVQQFGIDGLFILLAAILAMSGG